MISLRQRDRLGLVRQRETQRAHLGGQEAHGIVAALGQDLGAGHHADAQQIRHRVAAGDQQMNVLGLAGSYSFDTTAASTTPPTSA